MLQIENNIRLVKKNTQTKKHQKYKKKPPINLKTKKKKIKKHKKIK